MSGTTAVQLLAALADALDRQEPPCAEEPRLWLEPASTQQVIRAQEGCARCPGSHQCLAFARHVEPVIGIWAGHHLGPQRPPISAITNAPDVAR